MLGFDIAEAQIYAPFFGFLSNLVGILFGWISHNFFCKQIYFLCLENLKVPFSHRHGIPPRCRCFGLGSRLELNVHLIILSHPIYANYIITFCHQIRSSWIVCIPIAVWQQNYSNAELFIIFNILCFFKSSNEALISGRICPNVLIFSYNDIFIA